MEAFDDWYEGYERDGGELMLFNAIDLGAACKAGMLRAAEIAEKGFQPAKADGKHIYNYNAGRRDAATAIRKEANSGGT